MAKKRNRKKINKKVVRKPVKESRDSTPAPAPKAEPVSSDPQMETYYMNSSLLEELQKNSYEAHLNAVSEAVLSRKNDILGEDKTSNLSVIGTFKDHVLVVDESCNVYRLHIERDNSGISIQKVDKIEEVKRFTRRDIDVEFISEMTDNLLQLIASDTEECKDRFKESFEKIYTARKAKNEVFGYRAFRSES